MAKLILFPPIVDKDSIIALYNNALSLIKKGTASEEINFDFSDVTSIDSSGVIVINHLIKKAEQKEMTISLIHVADDIQKTITLFTLEDYVDRRKEPRNTFFERIGDTIYSSYLFMKDFLVLLSDISYYGLISFFKNKLRRRGEVIHQSVLIGVNALPIVSLIAFLVGFILALQSANQLRQFGASIFVADLVTVAMVSEMGPLITAIIIAGRSGSAIAAEIATMKVTEEVDALKTMGIDPIPYLFVPKLYAILITMPMLTIIANFIGILGGAIIGLIYLDINFTPFYTEVVTVLRYKEIIVAMIKSVTFALLIVITAIQFGLRTTGGPESVGKATTDSVVASIFFVILADTMIGLLFYL